jgi:hypothetical protein
MLEPYTPGEIQRKVKAPRPAAPVVPQEQGAASVAASGQEAPPVSSSAWIPRNLQQKPKQCSGNENDP